MTYTSCVDVVNETQGDGDHIQHSIALSWRKNIKENILNTETCVRQLKTKNNTNT